MKRILAALDRTEAARLVLDRAVELATATGAKVRLLRVVPETVSPPAPNIFEPAGDTNALVAEAEADLVFRSECIPEKLRDGVMVEVGEPWSTICEVARAYEADVVVIGAHRYGLVARMLGTTAAKIVNHLDRPVMVVRPTPPKKASKRPSEGEPESDERAGVPKPPHAMLGAAALAGGASGAVVGAVGGPPGAILGGTIGTAVGMLAGSALEEANEHAEAHDHELDDAIGVTKGDLGARESAIAGLLAMKEAERLGRETSGGMTSIGTLLREEHARLEREYAALLETWRHGDWSDARAQFARFEPALRAHMAVEEERVFPAFREASPSDAAALQREHDELRKTLDAFAIGIELHVIGERQAEALVRQLRAHGAKEEQLLYPWLDTTSGAEAVSKAFAA
jgi:nucleotide-binding universal stress UspA family protein/hemerythrin-like domain-containing protein